MPYTGMDERKEKKMDRCVEKVMATGKSKDAAIAICRSSMDATENEAIQEYVIAEWIKKYAASKNTKSS
jgi:hypothetical protein